MHNHLPSAAPLSPELERQARRKVAMKPDSLIKTLAAAAMAVGCAAVAQAQVGMTEWRAGALPVTLVYPTQAVSQTQTFGAFRIDVALNAAPLNQRQRLVVISHGTGGSAVANHVLAASLARAGFVVAQPDPRPDPRVAAVTLSVPLAVIFSPESLARIRVPVGVVTAQRDEVLLPRFHSAHLLAHCKTCTLLADLPGAGHFDVLWPWPDSVAREVAQQQVRGGMPVPGFDGRLREAAHAKIVSFHRQHLTTAP